MLNFRKVEKRLKPEWRNWGNSSTSKVDAKWLTGSNPVSGTNSSLKMSFDSCFIAVPIHPSNKDKGTLNQISKFEARDIISFGNNNKWMREVAFDILKNKYQLKNVDETNTYYFKVDEDFLIELREAIYKNDFDCNPSNYRVVEELSKVVAFMYCFSNIFTVYYTQDW